jgi:MFS family permease
MAVALFASTPLYVVFGAISDKIGRRPVILGACLLALLTYYPLFKALTYAANPALSRAIATAPLVVVADKRECSFQFDAVGQASFSSSCDVARSFLAHASVSYETVAGPPGSIATLRAGDRVLESFQGGALPPKELAQKRLGWEKNARAFISAAGYPVEADSRTVNVPLVLIILFVIMSIGAMSYAPIAAILTELFPARVRYTSVSFPYHLAIGWFGGFLPSIAFAIVAATGNIFSGLWYTLAFSASTLVVGALFLPETKNADISA